MNLFTREIAKTNVLLSDDHDRATISKAIIKKNEVIMPEVIEVVDHSDVYLFPFVHMHMVVSDRFARAYEELKFRGLVFRDLPFELVSQ